MHSTKMIVGPITAAAALAFAGAAAAEANPYFIGADQAFSYETNVYNLPSGQPQPGNVQGRTDAISTTSLVGGIDQPFGRQRFYANANVAYNKYKTNTVLDNTSYGVDVGLDWATIERLTGTVRISANQGLGSFSLYDTQQNFEKNVQDTQQAILTARWGITPRVGIEGGYIFRNVKMSNPLADSNEYSQNTVSLGTSYGGDGILELGAALRFSRTDYPKYLGNGSPTAPYITDEADGKNLDFTAKWVPSGLSTIDVRISLTDVSHTENVANDFRGVTGSLTWGYRATGRLYTRLQFLAAPGSGATFFDFSGAATPFVNNSRSSTIVRLSGTYELTGKIELNGFVGFDNDLIAQQQVVDGASTIVTGRALNSRVLVGAKYAATRNINANCYLQYKARNSSTPLTDSFWGNTVYCGAEVLLK